MRPVNMDKVIKRLQKIHSDQQRLLISTDSGKHLIVHIVAFSIEGKTLTLQLETEQKVRITYSVIR